MILGTASTYGVVATVFIAEHGKERPIQGRDVAESCGIPPEYLLKILQQLVRSRVLNSVRGRHGGFQLNAPPGRTNLLNIVEAIEGRVGRELILPRKMHSPQRTLDEVRGLRIRLADQAKCELQKTTVEQLMDHC